MRAGSYLRVSLDRTGEGLAVERQRAECQKLCALRGWEYAHEFAEDAVSAAGKVERPRFEALLTAVAAGEVDVVVAYAADRLGRNRRDHMRLMEACAGRANLSFVRGADVDLSSAMGRGYFDMLTIWSRLENEQKVERMITKNDQAARLGTLASGPLPFGWLPDRRTHHPVQAPAIAQAAEDVLAGTTLAAVARRWNADPALHSPRKRVRAKDRGAPSAWSAETVRALLLHPRNAGLIERDGATYPMRYPGTDGRPGEKVTPIIGEHTWRAVCATLTDPGRRAAPPTPRRLLSGVALCGVCGSPVNSGLTRRAGGYHSYRCRATNGHVAVRGDWIDDAVNTLVGERLARPDAVELLAARMPTVDVAGLRAKASAYRTKLESIANDFSDDPDMTPAMLRDMTRRTRANLEQVERELAEVGRTSALAGLLGAEDVRKAWADLDTDRRRAVIDDLVYVVLWPVGRGRRKFTPDSIWVRWR